MAARPDPDSLVRVKPIYPVYRVTGARFRIGAQRGLTTDIADPLGQMWTLVGHLDGTRTVAEVAAAVRVEHPSVGLDDVLAAVAALDRAGLVEPAGPTRYDADGPLRRYVGNVNYFSHYSGLDGSRQAPQDRLREAHCVLLGLGGGGSHILPLLVASGFGRLTLVDYDRVELTNLNRQLLYREADIGRAKTAAAADYVRAANSTVEVSVVDEKLVSARRVAELVAGADLVICAIDEPPFVAQRRVNAGCVAAGVPYVCCFSFVNRGRVFSVAPGRTGCFDCLHLHYARQDPMFLTKLRAGLANTRIGAVPIAFAPHIAAIGAFAAAEAARIVTGHAPPRTVGRHVELHYETGEWERLWEWPRSPGCPTCGDGSEAGEFEVWDLPHSGLEPA